jgi:hypothetical protein
MSGKADMDFVSDLDTKLLELSSSVGDVFTLRDSFDGGVFIFGGVGSAKTTGSAATLARALLRTGAGFLVCAAKHEEVETWERYAKENGRSNSVIRFDKTQGFNFCSYLLAQHGLAGIGVVVDTIQRLLEIADLASGQGAKGESNRFWSDTFRQALKYAIYLLYVAWGYVTIDDVLSFIETAPTSEDQMKSDAWQSSLFKRTLDKVLTPAVRADATEINAHINFWNRTYPAIPDETRGNIFITLSSRLDRFRYGRLADCFCGKTTITPEMCFSGAIILMDMPILEWQSDGVIGQQLFKFLWQRAVLSRNGLDPSQRDRGVYVWCDEAQHFLLPGHDDLFLSTSRASRAGAILISQSLPTLYAQFGQGQENSVNGLVGKCLNTVFHLNSCPVTNEFASKMIGRVVHQRGSGGGSTSQGRTAGMGHGAGTNEGTNSSNGSSSGSGGGSVNSSSGSSRGSNASWNDNRGLNTNDSRNWGYSEQMDWLVEPKVFASDLLNGGTRNKGKVTCIWFRAGGRFSANNGENCLKATFQQAGKW